jgi:hypothetical protein
MPGTAPVTRPDRDFLLRLQEQALCYFLDNQTPDGLILDRQRNHGSPYAGGLCSTAATGMGFIALALASAAPHRLIAAAAAARRVRTGLETALHRLPHDRGILPHFVDSRTGRPDGNDHLSTVDSGWLLAGALWAAAFLRDGALEDLAARLYERVDWLYWTADAAGTAPLLRHGQRSDGSFLPCTWDRLNGETVFLYVLASGAASDRCVPTAAWPALRPFYGAVGGRRFNNADLGLFVFQYGLDLLDLQSCLAPGGVDLAAEAAVAAEANHAVCRDAADRFATYRRFWGLSAGDGPAPAGYAYRCYAPPGPIDGTAHLTAALASVAHHPGPVLDCLRQADRDGSLAARGRYGFSNVNGTWVSPDAVGIDAGAAVLALDNYLAGDRVRACFHSLPCVRSGLDRAGFRPRRPLPAAA